MLIQLIFIRMIPVAMLGLFRKNTGLKIAIIIIGFAELYFLFVSCQMMIVRSGWRGLLYLPAAMFPQWFFYGFAAVIILRCVWQKWSLRVWKRIYCISCISTMIGILTEYYCNFQILKIFYEFIKKIF